MKNLLLLSLCFLTILSVCFGQENILPLWKSGEMPNYQKTDEVETKEVKEIIRIGNVQEPTLEIYLPAKRNSTGKAVVICPGGGYSILAYDWEGTDIAKWFNSQGIAAFVLKSRLPYSKSIIVGHQAPLQDAQRAIRLVRQNAEKWNISKDQIGIMGFSAGGHLASTLGTHYNDENLRVTSAIDTISARPDFMILIYPVITMNADYTHMGSRNNLIGTNPDQALIDQYSNELHVNKDTPPTFIVHSTDDKAVPVMNSISFYQAMQKADVYSEMHIYPSGGHGYGLALGKGHLQTWPDRLADWIDSLKQ
jgi:acetyl esterase/lipase